MKKIVLFIFVAYLCTCTAAYAQKQPAPDSKEYQKLKKEGKIKQAEKSNHKGNYPIFIDRSQDHTPTKGSAEGSRISTLSTESTLNSNSAETIEDPTLDPSFQVFGRNDDQSIGPIALPFTFNLYGNNYTSVYVNNNGNVSFGGSYGGFSSTGFPTTVANMIAPFWADVDTNNPNSGLVYYKVESTRFTVIWYRVGYYNAKADKLNTFKLIITNGNDLLIGIGNNIAFTYGDMQWTTGSASGGSDGFGGTPATVGVNKANGLNSCFFFQIGRFGKAGTEYVSPSETSGVDYLDNKYFTFDASVITAVSADFNYASHFCAVNFSAAIANPQNCQLNSYLWKFGDGTTSTDVNPVHAYKSSGTYTVKLEVNYKCGACDSTTIDKVNQVAVEATQDMFVEQLIQIDTDLKEETLAASAATFSDAWPLQPTNMSIERKNSYLNGALGVWRNNGTYIYEVPRLLSDGINIAKDGTYSLESFHWQNAELNAIPGWIKANSMTKYSSYSYELENQDAIGTYSAALYDYGGHLPSANGVNMRHSEMAFTSFEYLNGKASGNWIFGNEQIPNQYVYKVKTGLRNMAVVEASLKDLENVQTIDVVSRGIMSASGVQTKGSKFQYINGVEIVCKQRHPDNPEWSILIFRDEIFPGIWIGQVKVHNQVQQLVTPDIDNLFAHTGSSSLKVISEKVFKQPLLELEPGKKYYISAWVSINNPHVASPFLDPNLGIELILKNNLGAVLASTLLKPSGSIIEGWQQLKGSFLYPDSKAALELKFKPATAGPAWYDDLRLHPEEGNMKSYVYDLKDYRLQAILDEENFASLFYYDVEGNLHLVKKETIDGIKTITESINYQVER